MTELIIGREKDVERPRLIIQHEGKSIPMGKPGSVPMNVSRRHCRVLIDEDFNISIENLTADNFMYINGVDSRRKGHVSMDDVVELGPDHYRLNLDSIIKHFTTQRSYHIGHLHKVFDDYAQVKMTRQKRQLTFNALSSIPMVFTMGSMAVAFLVDEQHEYIRMPMYMIGFTFLIVFILLRILLAKSVPEKNAQIEEDFREKYRCPNPSCNHFLGQTPYKELLNNKTCPYCKAKFEE